MSGVSVEKLNDYCDQLRFKLNVAEEILDMAKEGTPVSPDQDNTETLQRPLTTKDLIYMTRDAHGDVNTGLVMKTAKEKGYDPNSGTVATILSKMRRDKEI